MKKLNILFVLLWVSTTLLAQDRLKNRADRLFEKKSYVEAAAMYEQVEESPDVLQNLGDSYYFNSKMTKAIQAYEKLFKAQADSIPKEIYFRYSQALMGLNRYEIADSLMTEYTGKYINTDEFKAILKEEMPFIHELKRLNKSGSSDFGLSYYGEKLVFASSRNTNGPKYDWNFLPYLDLFEADLSDEGELENVEPFSDKINTKTHESNAVFSEDGKTMYFSRTNEKRVKIGDHRIAVVKLYKASFVDSVWTDVKELPFTSDYYSTQHPALNKDGTKLFFSSDMPGSLGSFDLYYVDINGDSYGFPTNLGPTINTIHREQFPFIASDTLYFASDGHQGLGGLDVFFSIDKSEPVEKSDSEVTEENDEIEDLDIDYAEDINTPEEMEFTEPSNLGEPINTGLDDFSYIVDAETGYLSSNRTGDDNLYSFKRIINRANQIVGKIVDKNTQEIIPGAKAILYDELNNILAETIVDEEGKFVFESEPNKDYKVEGLADLHIPEIIDVTTNDYGTTEEELLIELETYDEAEDIVVERYGSTYIELENIYFDFDKWNILPEAAQTLDMLIEILDKYPRMAVELGAHTDSRGSDNYNLFLSVNRARSAMQYLISKGVDPNRLDYQGYGELAPLVDCGDKCSEIEYSINRRVEFKILR